MWCDLAKEKEKQPKQSSAGIILISFGTHMKDLWFDFCLAADNPKQTQAETNMSTEIRF